MDVNLLWQDHKMCKTTNYLMYCLPWKNQTVIGFELRIPNLTQLFRNFAIQQGKMLIKQHILTSGFWINLFLYLFAYRSGEGKVFKIQTTGYF